MVAYGTFVNSLFTVGSLLNGESHRTRSLDEFHTHTNMESLAPMWEKF